MRTNPKTAAAYLAATGIVLALNLAMLTSSPDTATGPTVLDPPWEQTAMVVTEAEIQAAQDLARYLRTLPGDGNQGEVRALEWTRGWINRPISNLDRVGPCKLQVGNRFIFGRPSSILRAARNMMTDPLSCTSAKTGFSERAREGSGGVTTTMWSTTWRALRHT
ncbi:MAG: hypothetical protein OXF88_18725 [Rhodobacteraceae bacterium]|nr:hypothetical protein [Paracoccaceae bacterium]